MVTLGDAARFHLLTARQARRALRQPTRAERLLVRANFCNLTDTRGSGRRSIIYTSTMPTVWVRDRSRAEEWLAIQVEAGSTHVVCNVPEAGPSYGGIWDQPDLWGHLNRYADFLDWLRGHAGANGLALTPIPFLDSGGRDPLPRIRERWPRFADTMRRAGHLDAMIGVIAFEPVVGDWRSRDVSEALQLAHRLMPEMLLGYHGSPGRLVGSSNPVESDDPWQGAEAGFYTAHGGEHIDIAMYQTPHGRSLYEACSADDPHCWLDRWRDYVRRIGGGLHGWRTLPICLMETVAYEYIRGQATSANAREVASRGKAVADAAGVAVGYGNGLPWEN